MYAQLFPLLKEYQIILEDYLPSKGTRFDDILQYQNIFLDLANIHRKLIKSLCLLISVDDSEMDISIYTICRSLTANTLTTYYFQSFIDEKKKIDNETVCNELRALSSEFISRFVIRTNKLQHIYEGKPLIKFADKYPELFEGEQLKSHLKFHILSNQSIIESMGLKDGMLSEEQKMGVAILKLPDKKNYILNTLYLNKLFTQYYHYNHIGGKWSRTSNIDRCNEVIIVIGTAIEALTSSLSYLETILPTTNEFVRNSIKLANAMNLLVDKSFVIKY